MRIVLQILKEPGTSIEDHGTRTRKSTCWQLKTPQGRLHEGEIECPVRGHQGGSKGHRDRYLANWFLRWDPGEGCLEAVWGNA